MQPKQGDQAVLAVNRKNILISSGHVLNGLCSGSCSGPCVGVIPCSLWSEPQWRARKTRVKQIDLFIPRHHWQHGTNLQDTPSSSIFSVGIFLLLLLATAYSGWRFALKPFAVEFVF